MTCSKNLGRLLQVTCLGLIGTLAVAGCGGSEGSSNRDGSLPPGSEGGPPLPPVVAVAALPATVPFGSVVLGQTSSTPSVVTVTNRGTVAASLTPTVTAPFAIASTNCAALPLNGTCTIALTFTPTVAGPATGVLIVTSTVSVTLTGTGVLPASFTVTDKVDLGQVLAGAPVAGAITVTNTDTVPIAVLSCTTSGADIAADALRPCVLPLAVGASCNFGFTFTAASAGAKSDSIVCTSTGTTRYSAVTAVAVTPANLALQLPTTQAVSSPVGTASSLIGFTLVNSGGSASGALTVTPTGDVTDFIVDNQCILPLAASSLCKINVVFKPAAVGAKALTLTIVDAAAGVTAKPLVAIVNGTALKEGSLTLTGAVTDFGSVQVGGSSNPLVFTVTNSGQTETAAVTVASSDAQFAITSNACNSVALGAGKSCNFSVAFRPSGAGAQAASLTASATGTATATLSVKGVGTGAPALTMAPSSLDFGGIVIRSTSTTKSFTVTNSGQNPTGVLEVVKDDSTSSTGGGSQFTYTTTCSAALAPNATCNVVVTFAPLQAGSASATITVRTVDRAVTTQPGTLLGLGLAAAQLEILDCDDDGDFSNAYTVADGTVVSKTSNPITCTVKNNGTTASGAITTTTAGDFAVSTDNCRTANLQSGMTCTVAVTFSPTLKGRRTGVLSVASVNSGNANQQLVGLGLGILEIVEEVDSETIDPQPYDFEQVPFGQRSTTDLENESLTLKVFVRAAIGNLVITRTGFTAPADFAFIGAADAEGDCRSSTAEWYSSSRSKATAACTMVVEFSPVSRGAKSGSVTATGANSQTDSATFIGTGTGPLTIAPSPLTFGSVGLGSAEDLTLTVTNQGAASLTAASLTLAGANASEFVISDDEVSDADIAADAHSHVTVRFVPATAGAKTATITVNGTYGTGTETATVTLTGTGGNPARLTATLGSAFAATAINASSAAVTVTVTNAGAVASTAVNYELSDDAEYTLVPTEALPAGQTKGTCGDAGDTALAPGQSCTIKVWFMPVVGLGLGARTAILEVSAAGGGIVKLNLTGNATPQLSISPATIHDFGSVVLGNSDSATRTFTVTNHSDTAASVTVAFDDNANNLLPSLPGQFTIDNNCSDPVDGRGGTCTIVTQMVPSVAGLAYATLVVTDGDTEQTATVDVQGTGLDEAHLIFTSGTAIDRNFGQVRMGYPSAPVTYTIQNDGDVTTGTLSYGLYTHRADYGQPAVEHPKSSDFVMTASTCPTDRGLGAGASCNIVITFRPTTTGDDTGEVDVDLIVKATPGSPTAGVVIADDLFPEIKGDATTLGTDYYLVENSTGLSPYTFPALGAATSLTITMALKAGNTAGEDGTATPIFTDLSGNGTYDSLCPDADDCEFVVDDTLSGCVDPMPANGVCTFTVVWTPAVDGDDLPIVGKREITIGFDGDDVAGAPTATLVAVVPTRETLVARPSTIDFGNLLKLTPATLTLTVTNEGETATEGNLIGVKLAGAALSDVAFVTATGCTGHTLAAGASCILPIKITPTLANLGEQTVTVRVGDAHDLDNLHTGAVTLTWTAFDTAQVTADETNLDFNEGGEVVPVGVTSTTKAVALTNTADGRISGPLNISVDDANFAVYATNPAGPQNTDCSNAAFARGLEGGDSCNIFVTFTPNALASPAKSGTVTVAYANGTSAEIILSGTATPALTVTALAGAHSTEVVGPPATVAFDSTVVGGTLYEATVTFTNATTKTTAPTTGQLLAALSGTGASQFRIVTDNCTGETKATNTSCTVVVRFAPTTAGAKTATLTLSGTPGDSATVALSGTATNTAD